jgi:hypothetical protein
VTIPCSGEIARVEVKQHHLKMIDGIKIEVPTYGAVTGLPAAVAGRQLIVSTMVAEALRASGERRDDIYTPDSGPSAIRENGQIKAVRCLLYRGC